MTDQDKLGEITAWYSETRAEETRNLSAQKDESRIEIIEKLLSESIPENMVLHFKKFDGETGTGYGSFLGHSIVGLDEIINSLEFAKTQVKPDVPKITHPEKSKLLLEQIIKHVVDEIPLKKKFGFIKPKWFKIEFEAGPGSLSGPYFYINKDTSDREREVIKLPRAISSKVTALTKELHALEVDDYNWDTLKLNVFGNGKNEVNRSFYNFNQVLPLASTPKNAIKKKYFHIKWLPLISDNCGNYIGLDLDPDLCGVKGQVIIFGRDEEDMYVLANSWNDFLDWSLELIRSGGEEFKKDRHLHDVYKELIKARPVEQKSPTPELGDIWKQPAKGYTDKTEGRIEEQILLKEKEIGFTFPELYREHMKIQNGGYLWKSALIHNEDINELLYNGSIIDPIINHDGYTTLKDVLIEYMDLEEIRESSKYEFLDLDRLPILSHMDGHTMLCFDYGYNVESEYEIPQIVYFELECADNGFEEKLRVDSYDNLISKLVYYGYESTSFYIGLKSELPIDKIKESFSDSLKVEFKHHDDDGYGWYNFESWYSSLLPVNSELSIHMRLTPNKFLSGNYLFQKLTEFNYILELDLRIGVTSFADNSDYQKSIIESQLKPALDLFDWKFLLVPFNKVNEQELDHLQSTSH